MLEGAAAPAMGQPARARHAPTTAARLPLPSILPFRRRGPEKVRGVYERFRIFPTDPSFVEAFWRFVLKFERFVPDRRRPVNVQEPKAVAKLPS